MKGTDMDISKSWKGRLLGVFLGAVLIVGLMSSIALATDDKQLNGKSTETIEFLKWDDTKKELVTASIGGNGGTEGVTSYTVVDNSMTGTWNAGWYVVNGDVTMTNADVTVSGAVHLILADGCSLSVTGQSSPGWTAGICVSGDSNSLTIYGQSNQTGKLNAKSGGGAAGIGGKNNFESCSNITINGGDVTATGIGGGAGIGGLRAGSGSKITINGGTVTATGGGGGAGIGGGYRGSGSKITINGGTVTARGSENGAGIGGGYSGSGSDITINGGKVIATGGAADGGASGSGIGGGGGDDMEVAGNGSKITINGGEVTAASGNAGNMAGSGAGIGGGGADGTDNGPGGSGSDITINGGKVTATAGDTEMGCPGAGIGGGGSNSMYDGPGGSCSNININGGSVTATGGADYMGEAKAAGIGGGDGFNSKGAAEKIYAKASVIVKAGASPNPTDSITHDSTTDIAGNLAGKQYATAALAFTTFGGCEWAIDGNGVLTIKPATTPAEGYTSGQLPNDCKKAKDWPWYGDKAATAKTITKVVIATGVKAGNSTAVMFSGCEALESIDVSNLDTSSVTNMKSMFHYCSTLESIDVSKLNTKNVTNMNLMFGCCSALKSIEGLSKLDTSSVTDMSAMFASCEALESIDISKFDTKKVEGMGFMFADCTLLNAETRKAYIKDLLEENEGKCTNWTAGLFDGCTDTTIDVSDLDTSNVTDISNMFNGCKTLESIKGLSELDTKKVEDISAMFYNCLALTSLDLSNFDTSNVIGMAGVFYGCSKLTSLDLSNFDTSNVIDMAEMFYNCSTLKTILVGSKWSIQSTCAGDDMFSGCTSLKGGAGTTCDGTNNIGIDYAKIDGGTSNPGYLTSLEQLNCTIVLKGGKAYENKLSGMDITAAVADKGLSYTPATENTPATWTMKDFNFTTTATTVLMFVDEGTDESPVDINIVVSGTNNVKGSSDTVVCFGISFQRNQSVTISGNGTLNVTSGDVGQGGNSFGVSGASGSSLKFSGSDLTVNIKGGSGAGGAVGISAKKVTIEDAKITCETGAAAQGETVLIISSLSVTGKGSLRAKCSESGTGEKTAVYDASAEPDAKAVKTGTTTKLTWDSTDKTYKNGTNVATDVTLTRVQHTIGGCEWSIDNSGVLTIQPVATPAEGYESGQLPDGYTQNSDWPWYGDSGATAKTITKAVIASGVKAGNSTANMFNACNNLTSIDLSKFDTSNVTNMGAMFIYCKALKTLDLSNFNTSKVTNMQSMFFQCYKLESLDLSSFDTSSVTNMNKMLSDCHTFETLDLSSFDTSNVTNMGEMFSCSSKLKTLDLSGFDTSNVTDMHEMFGGCSDLETILVGSKWSTEKVTSSNNMFFDCSSLVGSKGTKCDGKNNIKATYARVDGGVDSPGYLTFKKYGADKTAIQGDGATWTLGSNDALVLSCGGELADCTSIRISGNGIDMQLYDGKGALVEGVTVTEGSTVLTVQPAVLEKLAPGTYQVTFSYDEEKYDPATSTATLTIAAAPDMPKAGDSAGMQALALVGLAIAAAAAMGLALVASRRRRNQ